MLDKDKRLYGQLRCLEEDVRSAYSNLDLPDKEYFRQGIIFDIVANMIPMMLCNEFSDPEISQFPCMSSPGIDLNCRAILESISILRKFDSGGFDDWNYYLYRNSYLTIESGNDPKVYKIALEHEIPLMADLRQKREQFYKKLQEHYGITDSRTLKKLKKEAASSDFYIRDKWDVAPPFSKGVKEISKESYNDYELFNFFVHTNVFHDEIRDELLDRRRVAIWRTFTFAIQELRDRNLLNVSDDSRFDNDRAFYETQYNLECTEKMFGLLASLFFIQCNVGKTNEYDLFYKGQIEVLTLWKDIDVCRAFGFNEQAISKFKVFAEKTAYIYGMCFLEMDKKSPVRYAFTRYCDLEAAKLINVIDGEEYFDIESFQEALQEEYQENWSHVFKTPEEFELACRGARGLIEGKLEKGKSKGISAFIKDLALEWVGIERSVQFEGAFNTSLDMGHSCGYSLNSSDNIWNVKAFDCYILMSVYFLDVISRFEEPSGLDAEEKRYYDHYMKVLPLQLQAEIKTVEEYHSSLSEKVFKEIVSNNA